MWNPLNLLTTLYNSYFSPTVPPPLPQKKIQKETTEEDFALQKVIGPYWKQASIGQPCRFLEPSILCQWTIYQENKSIDPKRINANKAKFLWIKTNFPELYEKCVMQNQKLQELQLSSNEPTQQVPLAATINKPLNDQHIFLCIGGGSLANGRKHDLDKTYTTNLEAPANPDVVDDIRMLPTRKYLDLNGKPHLFEKIYIEVSCSEQSYIFPEMLIFLHQHLIPGGTLYLELPYRLINETLTDNQDLIGKTGGGIAPLGGLWTWEKESVHIEGVVEDLEITHMGNNVKFTPHFHGDWQKYFQKFDFIDIAVSNIGPCQIASLPIEMKKQ